MKTYLASLMAIFGLSSVFAQAAPVQKVDLSDALYTVPTISNDLPPLENTRPIANRAGFRFHEDEWSQIEFVPESKVGAIKKLLSEYRAFEAKSRTQFGKNKEYTAWNDVYVRRLNREPVIPGQGAVSELTKALGLKLGSPPEVFSSSTVSSVAAGFSIPLGANVTLYGYADGTGIPVLGAFVGESADYRVLAEAFGKLHKRWGVVLVDWRQQLLIVSTAKDGRLESWHP